MNAKTNELSQINLLTIQEVADWARVSNKTVYRWISDHFNRQTTIGKPFWGLEPGNEKALSGLEAPRRGLEPRT